MGLRVCVLYSDVCYLLEELTPAEPHAYRRFASSVLKTQLRCVFRWVRPLLFNAAIVSWAVQAAKGATGQT